MFYSDKHRISFKIKSKFIKFYMFFGNIWWLYLCFQSTRVTPKITLKSLCSSLRPKYISMFGVKYPSKKYTEERNIYIYTTSNLGIFSFHLFFSFHPCGGKIQFFIRSDVEQNLTCRRRSNVYIRRSGETRKS